LSIRLTNEYWKFLPWG